MFMLARELYSPKSFLRRFEPSKLPFNGASTWLCETLLFSSPLWVSSSIRSEMFESMWFLERMMSLIPYRPCSNCGLRFQTPAPWSPSSGRRIFALTCCLSFCSRYSALNYNILILSSTPTFPAWLRKLLTLNGYLGIFRSESGDFVMSSLNLKLVCFSKYGLSLYARTGLIV